MFLATSQLLIDKSTILYELEVSEQLHFYLVIFSRNSFLTSPHLQITSFVVKLSVMI